MNYRFGVPKVLLNIIYFLFLERYIYNSVCTFVKGYNIHEYSPYNRSIFSYSIKFIVISLTISIRSC